MKLSRTAELALARAPRVGDWIGVNDGKFVIKPGKVEIGQGIHSALAQIAAHRLGVDVTEIAIQPVSTDDSPDEGVTSGSLSIEDSGHLIAAAALTLADLIAADPREADGRSLAKRVRPAHLTCPVDARRGIEWNSSSFQRSAARRDLVAKVGRGGFLHDLTLVGMIHARILRGPYHRARPVATDRLRAAAAERGIGVLIDGAFIALTGQREAALVRFCTLADELVEWDVGVDVDDRAWLERLTEQESDTAKLVESKNDTPSPACHNLSARYEKAWLSHGSIGPSCAVAQWRAGRLQVWSHSQGIFNLRRDLAIALDIDEQQVSVAHIDGPGCYGHNGADDVAFDAAIVSRAINRPVRVLWRRKDEACCAPFGPASVIELSARLAPSRTILQWRSAVWSTGHSSRPGRSPTPALLGAWQTAAAHPEPNAVNMPIWMGGGTERNAVPLYTFGDAEVAVHLVKRSPVRSSAMRALGAMANVFAIESFMDELAEAADADPVDFRLRHLTDNRAIAVLNEVVEMSGWRSARSAPSGSGRGFGCGVARYKNSGAYCAVVAEVSADEMVKTERLWIAADVGTAINRDGVLSQLEGGAVQATSWTLREAVRFDQSGVTSSDWESYPILRFSEVPRVAISLLQVGDRKPLGAGEASCGPTVGAIANAVTHALGIRVRRLPITPEQVVASAIGEAA